VQQSYAIVDFTVSTSQGLRIGPLALNT
jgi:hypothetical protein